MTILLEKMSQYDAMSGWELQPVGPLGIPMPVFVGPSPADAAAAAAAALAQASQIQIAQARAAAAAAAASAPPAADTAASNALLVHQAAVLNGPEPTTAAGYLERGSLRIAQAGMLDFSDPRFASWQMLAQQDFDKAKALSAAQSSAAARATGASSSMMAYYAIAGLVLAGGAFYFLKSR